MALQVGITGGIGTGKSLVSRIFRCLGVPVYDADSRAKYVMTTDGILISQIKKEFGELSYHRDGSLNREYLRLAFKNPEQLAKLNAMVHPRVAKDYAQWVKDHCTYPYVLKEAALLFESKSYLGLDRVIVVSAPEVLRIERVMKRDGRSADEVREIMLQQMAESEKTSLADHVVYNDESTSVILQVLSLHEQFISASR